MGDTKIGVGVRGADCQVTRPRLCRSSFHEPIQPPPMIARDSLPFSSFLNWARAATGQKEETQAPPFALQATHPHLFVPLYLKYTCSLVRGPTCACSYRYLLRSQQTNQGWAVFLPLVSSCITSMHPGQRNLPCHFRTASFNSHPDFVFLVSRPCDQMILILQAFRF